jgi:hypothetical protein
VVAVDPKLDLVDATEHPEISEISEFPEIREVESASAVQASHVSEPEPAVVVEVNSSPEIVRLETIAPVEEPAAQLGVVSGENQETIALAVASPGLDRSDGGSQTAKNGGFFKRLFGKFGR